MSKYVNMWLFYLQKWPLLLLFLNKRGFERFALHFLFYFFGVAILGKFTLNEKQHLTNLQCSCNIEVCCFADSLIVFWQNQCVVLIVCRSSSERISVLFWLSVDCLLKQSGVYDLLSKHRSLLVGSQWQHVPT